MDPENIIYRSMNEDQRSYANGQFWGGAALGVLVGVIAAFIGLYYYIG